MRHCCCCCPDLQRQWALSKLAGGCADAAVAAACASQQGERSWQGPAADARAAGPQAQAASEGPRHTALQLQTWQVAAGWAAGCCGQRVARQAWAGKGHAALQHAGPPISLPLPGCAGSGLLQAVRRLSQGSGLLHAAGLRASLL